MADNEWWRTFFSGVTVEFWLKVPTEDQTRAEADFLVRRLQLPAGGTVLDLACGGGRHAVDMALCGHEVTGVDLSSEFLEAARALAAERSVLVAWEQREMRDLPWAATFDGAYCFGNAFGYLDDDGNAAFVKAVARALKPGGRFVIETGVAAESILPTLHERRWYDFGDLLFLIHNRYDHVRSRLETDYTFVRNGQVETRPGSQRVYTYGELGRLMGDAGFGDIEGFGSLAEEPFRLGSPRLYLSATKIPQSTDDPGSWGRVRPS
jgi:SAM-dependent methyltransferase